jgi:hypothetical protein
VVSPKSAAPILCPRRATVRVTANAADVIIANTPVA